MYAVTDLAAVKASLNPVKDPLLNQSLAELGWLENVVLDGDTVLVDLVPTYAGASEELRPLLLEALAPLGVEQLGLRENPAIPRVKPQGTVPALDRVKNVIAVSSGKGGVGKSTTAVNLALALAAQGARVGMLDADIYGPSQPMMLGIPAGTRPEVKDNAWFIPIQAHGIEAMSIGFLLEGDSSPVVWRGPKATGALLQMLQQTLWSDLDFLIIDMPPGTGDIALTLAQKVPVAGSVIVTTPQDIALLDAKKGIEMFRKVEIPVLGVVENMSLHICTNCGHADPIFGSGGGERIARDYQTELLGQLPLDARIREQADDGCPTVVAEPEADLASRYRAIARKVGAAVAKAAHSDPKRINIVFE
ncbi:MAG: iron-sulfur cluster carrier protein ApbC [Moraxellaceae bacterium]|nr:iron-sulfur cluster carrier protein ApbC [Moraxellaceae bacterium]MBP8852215.1 iron-sulfur cluster carrier protein ApbC [Moraxellaceae bacterium]MBP9045807.1 iron-sulfur cluster carrier protein ApbC [Moraxellaceae bacterium]MBP9729941.1 iron-sulfur cluster carrier protein ApbC [Moraxellaceae bacterium]MCC6201330.1 iron-sulfur cluster carrier protein ApbC [Moraxellaceae bacterium]